jgi:hypothetical protein
MTMNSDGDGEILETSHEFPNSRHYAFVKSP